jgi:probable HAF family extracellular repeat protein
MHELPTLGARGVDAGSAIDVNASGVAVGASRIANGFLHAAMYKDGVVIDLGTLAGTERSNSVALAINDRGVIVGTSDSETSRDNAVMWVDGSILPLGPGRATAVNAAGDAVGGLTLYRGGETTPISIVPGFERGAATDINDAGVIVGWMYHQRGIEIPGVRHGFIHYDGSTYDLNDLQTPHKALIASAVAINNAGQIAAYGQAAATDVPLIVTCRR